MNVHCVDGQIEAQIPGDDRGLAYGHGVFETMEVRAGEIPHWTRHWRRLSRGGQRIGLQLPEEEQVYKEAMALIVKRSRAVLKLVLTSGSGVGYYVPQDSPARRILSVSAWRERDCPQAGVTLCLCRTRLPSDPQLAGIKHLNRLHSVLARNEWDTQYDEGLLCDASGDIIEGTMSNIFWIEHDTLLTPDLSHCGVAGIMRERILEWASRKKRAWRLEPCQPQRLAAANGAFVCNSLIGVWPVARFQHTQLPRHPLIERVTAAVLAGDC